MDTIQIKTRYKEKELELLNKYFGDFVHEVAIERPETIEVYTTEPLKIEVVFRVFGKSCGRMWLLAKRKVHHWLWRNRRFAE